MPYSPPFAGVTSYIEIKTLLSVTAGGSNGKTLNIISHWRRTATTATLNKTNIDTAYQAAIAVPIFAALNARATQTFNQIRSMDDANDGYLAVAHAVVGSIAGDSEMTDVAAFMLFRTNLRQRSGRGNKHFAPMSESDKTSGTDDVWNAGCLARLATIAAAFIAGFTDANGNVWVPCIMSRRPPAQYAINPTTIVSNDVVQAVANKRIGSMNHRKVKSVY